MPKIELIYDNHCPNVGAARARLREALAAKGWKVSWLEWVRQEPDAPDYVSRFASPTILIDGEDVGGGGADIMADSCRVYRDETGRMQGIPSLRMVLSCLEKAMGPSLSSGIVEKRKGHWKFLGGVLPVLGTIFIPGITCPACWPAYAGLLSSLGLGFFNYTPYLLPMTLALVMVALFALGFRAKRRHGYLPLLMGSIASIALISGRFFLNSDWVLYGGIGGLIIASIWNSWPVKKIPHPACPACTSK